MHNGRSVRCRKHPTRSNAKNKRSKTHLPVISKQIQKDMSTVVAETWVNNESHTHARLP